MHISSHLDAVKYWTKNIHMAVGTFCTTLWFDDIEMVNRRCTRLSYIIHSNGSKKPLNISTIHFAFMPTCCGCAFHPLLRGWNCRTSYHIYLINHSMPKPVSGPNKNQERSECDVVWCDEIRIDLIAEQRHTTVISNEHMTTCDFHCGMERHFRVPNNDANKNECHYMSYKRATTHTRTIDAHCDELTITWESPSLQKMYILWNWLTDICCICFWRKKNDSVFGHFIFTARIRWMWIHGSEFSYENGYVPHVMRQSVCVCVGAFVLFFLVSSMASHEWMCRYNRHTNDLRLTIVCVTMCCVKRYEHCEHDNCITLFTIDGWTDGPSGRQTDQLSGLLFLLRFFSRFGRVSEIKPEED